MESLGAEVHVITEASEAEGGLLGARLDHVRELCAADERYVWLDQYGNPSNWRAHYRTTAPSIVRQFPDLDVLFVGAGPPGTLMGCARFLREWPRPVRIVAVDSVGSVTFGARPAAGSSPASERESARGSSTSPTWTTSYTSRRRRQSGCAAALRGAASCSAARPAPSSAARWTGFAKRRRGPDRCCNLAGPRRALPRHDLRGRVGDGALSRTAVDEDPRASFAPPPP